jgi:hypothetical protein
MNKIFVESGQPAEPTLNDQIQKVKATREILESRTQKLHELQVAFNQANKGLIEEKCKLEIDCDDAERRLREMTIAAYRASGNKKPAPGVGIRMKKSLKYMESLARSWALKDGHNFLKLDKEGFEAWAGAILKMGQEPPIQIDIVETPQATIAKEL